MSASSNYLDVLTRLESAKAANQAEAIRARAQAMAGAQQANAGLWGTTIANIGQMVSQIPQQRAELDRIKNQAAETQLRREQMQREAEREKRADQEEQTIRDLYSTAAQEFQQSQGLVSEADGIRIGDAIEREKAAGTYRGPDDAGQFQPINAPTGGQMLPQPINAPTGGVALRKTPFPTPLELMSKLSPKTAISLINAQAALQKIDPKADPKTKVEQLQTFYKGFQKMPHDMKVSAYPALLELFEKNEYLPVGVLPREWSDETEAFIMGTGQEPAKPTAPDNFTLSPGQTRFGPDGKPIANVPAPEKPAGGESGFTLSPGQTRYGPDGKPIASRPDRPQAPADKKRTDDLVATVLENPALWDQLTPTVRGEIAPELRARGYTNFGKPLSEAAMKQIAESNSAIDSLTDLRSVLKENEQYIGPIAGLSAMNPYSDARKAQAKIDLVRQRVGKALEGGVLRKEDEEKYKKILATLRDTPETAVYKVDQLIKNIQNNVDQFKAAQRLGGKNLDLTGSTPAAPAAPAGDGSVSVSAPNGKTYIFKSKADADAFKAKAGIP